MKTIRRQVRQRIQHLMASDDGDHRRPSGDPGLFGPGSAAWVVHGDFTTMMIGGIAALLMQMLHPAALAGVWDHSDFRRDTLGRLRRTARFIAVTTYGATDDAERLIAHVRRIHDGVSGRLPDGTPYSANDPTLLTWVHVAEVSCFLQAFLRYRRALSLAEQDRYFAEMAGLARRLGATDVPETRRDADAYLHAMRPSLRADDRTREIVSILLSQPAPESSMAPLGALFLQAGVDALPGWGQKLHGLRMADMRKPVIRAGAHGAGTALRWALRDECRNQRG